MRIRWNRRNAFPLLLLAVLYAVSAAHMAQRYSRCDSTLPEGLASGLEWVDSGLSWLSEASSRLRLGSWLGNSWAPGSIGWKAASASPSERPQPGSLSDADTWTVQAANSFEILDPGWAAIEPRVVHADSDSAQILAVPDCAKEPLIVLAQTEVVIVTAEFPRLETSEVGLVDLPDRPDPASAHLPPRTGCQFRLIGPAQSKS